MFYFVYTCSYIIIISYRNKYEIYFRYLSHDKLCILAKIAQHVVLYNYNINLNGQHDSNWLGLAYNDNKSHLPKKQHCQMLKKHKKLTEVFSIMLYQFRWHWHNIASMYCIYILLGKRRLQKKKHQY